MHVFNLLLALFAKQRVKKRAIVSHLFIELCVLN